MSKTYRVGTRDSLLARVQSQQICDQLHRITGDHYQLKTIKTQGDLKLDRPLYEYGEQNLFTKELTTALLDQKIDLVVHSYKDLGTGSIPGVALAAITKREYAQDILLYRKDQCSGENKQIIIGTSSPRRKLHIQKYLKKFLPFHDNYSLLVKVLRGNIHNRIGKLKGGGFHGIVLALAGLERLTKEVYSMSILEKLLEDLDFMILPQEFFPSAPAQGSLAIQCLEEREDAGELLEKLNLLHHPATEKNVHRERTAFSKYGGGCHLALGIHVKNIQGYFLSIHRGKIEKKSIVKISIEPSPHDINNTKSISNTIFIGLQTKKIRSLASSRTLIGDEVSKRLFTDSILPSKDLYITSKHVISTLEKSYAPGTELNLWAAGNSTMKSLASKGYWVRGSAEGFGEDEMIQLLRSRCLQIFTKSSKLLTLSHTDATTRIGNIFSCYKKNILSKEELSLEYIEQIEKTSVFFWTSYGQYESFTSLFPTISSAMHCCGMGKTLKKFIEAGLNPRPFYNIQSFLEWVDI